MSERKRGSSAGEESSTMSVPAKKARGERGRGRGRDNTSLTLLPPGEEAGGTGPLHPQAAARGAGEEENAVAQQGGSRGDGLVTRDLISAFDRPSASSVNDAGTRTLDLISSMDPRGVSSTNHEAGGRDGVGHESTPSPLSQGGEALAVAGTVPRPNARGPGIFPGNGTGMMEAPISEGGAPPLSSIPTDAALRQLVRREVRSFVSQPEVQQFLAMQHFATPGGQPSTWTGEASRGITPRHDASPSELHGSARALAPPAAGKLVASTGEGDSGSHLPQPQTIPGLCPGCHRRQGTFWRRPDEPASQMHVCLCTVCLHDWKVVCPVCACRRPSR